MSHQVTVGQRTLRLALCATVAGAAFAMPTAHAVTITVDFSGNPLSTVPFNIDGMYLNLVTGVATTGTATGYDINPYFSGSAGASPLFRFLVPASGGLISAGGIATPLAVGTVIDSTSTFVSGISNATQSTVPATSYFGLRFVNESTGITNYGYLTVSQSANPVSAGSVRVLGYSYENAGAGIAVAAVVPEPSTTIMMLAGLLGAGAFGLHRRRKNA